MVAGREKDREGAPRASVAGSVTGRMTTFPQGREPSHLKAHSVPRDLRREARPHRLSQDLLAILRRNLDENECSLLEI